MHLESPRLQESTIRTIWYRAMDVLAPLIRNRLSIDVTPALHQSERVRDAQQVDGERLHSADGPAANYTYEVLRFLLNEVLGGASGWFTPAAVQRSVGASAPTVRRVLRMLHDSGVIEIAARGAARPLRMPPVPWSDLLARLGAPPPILRFNYRAGGRDLRALLGRAESRLQHFPEVAVSGAVAAVRYQPSLDLVGVPRLDFVAQVSQSAHVFVNVIDAELRPEPNPLASAAVVVTLTHALEPRFQTQNGLRMGGMGDIVLALEDARLYDIAHSFGHGVHRWQ